MAAQRARLSADRWHFQHGPIDIVIGAEGVAAAVDAAHEAAWVRFETVLDELVAELPALRSRVLGPCPPRGTDVDCALRGTGVDRPLRGTDVDRPPRGTDVDRPLRGTDVDCPLRGQIAQKMWWACCPHHAEFITPMAAVAGAVAQELIGAYARPGVQRAWVNNGGDIALHLAPGTQVRVGLFADLARFDLADAAVHTDGHFDVHAAQPVRGIATSGWRGRSLSLGIADSVTVLAHTAAAADAAATVIANAVNADDARIRRRPANEVHDDSDLGEIEVVVDVAPLPAGVVRQALQRGARRARELQRAGLIHAAVLVCQGQVLRVDGHGLRPTDRRAEVGSAFA